MGTCELKYLLQPYPQHTSNPVIENIHCHKLNADERSTEKMTADALQQGRTEQLRKFDCGRICKYNQCGYKGIHAREKEYEQKIPEHGIENIPRVSMHPVL